MLQIKVNNKSTYVVAHEDDQWHIDEQATDFDVERQPNGLISVLHNGKSYTAMVLKVDRKAKELTIQIDGQNYTIAIKEPIDQLLSSMGLDMSAMKKGRAC